MAVHLLPQKRVLPVKCPSCGAASMGRWVYDPEANRVLPRQKLKSGQLPPLIDDETREVLPTGSSLWDRITLVCVRPKCHRRIDVDPADLAQAFLTAARAGTRSVTPPRPIPAHVLAERDAQRAIRAAEFRASRKERGRLKE